MVNFSVKQLGLEAQLLGIVVQREQPSLEEQSSQLTVKVMYPIILLIMAFEASAKEAVSMEAAATAPLGDKVINDQRNAPLHPFGLPCLQTWA